LAPVHAYARTVSLWGGTAGIRQRQPPSLLQFQGPCSWSLRQDNIEVAVQAAEAIGRMTCQDKAILHTLGASGPEGERELLQDLQERE